MIKIKLLLYVFFIIQCTNSLFGTVINPPQNLGQHILNPENTVFMFDVDGVLAERGFWKHWQDYWEIIKKCPWWQSIQFLGWQLWNLPSFFSRLDQENIFTYLDSLAKQWPFLNKKTAKGTIVERLKETINQGTPKQETIHILLNLYTQGFPITIASNQARETFNYLVNNHILPDFSHYTLIFTPDYPGFPYTKKPCQHYYQNCKKALAQQGIVPEYFIFIDDRYENVLAASHLGIISILFNNASHNPAQELEKDLASLGIYSDKDSKEKGREKKSLPELFLK